MSDSNPYKGLLEPQFNQHVILYVDDETHSRTLFQMAFRGDFQVLCAGNAEEAMEVLATQKVSVLVTDQRMGGMTGVDLCELVKERYPDTCRILVTAYSDQETAIDAINRGGVQRYIRKPLVPEEVRLLLREAVTRIHLEEMVVRLRNAMEERERQAVVAATHSGIVHDLGNGLVTLHTCCESLHLSVEEGEATQDMVVEDLKDLRETTAYLCKVHERARSTRRLLASEQSWHSVGDLLDTTARLVKGELNGHIRLTRQCPSDLMVWADSADVCRILVNLLGNACHAINESSMDRGTITTTVEQKNERVLIRVTDTGPGIPDAMQSVVFEPFATSRIEIGGNGLGLAISRELARANDGDLRVEDTSPSGTTFLLELPTDPAEPESPTAAVA